jgi:hypothetical protein
MGHSKQTGIIDTCEYQKEETNKTNPASDYGKKRSFAVLNLSLVDEAGETVLSGAVYGFDPSGSRILNHELVLGAKRMSRKYVQGRMDDRGGDLWQARVALRVTHSSASLNVQ